MKTAAELKVLSKGYFDFNPLITKLYATTDGNFFEKESTANNHLADLKRKESSHSVVIIEKEASQKEASTKPEKEEKNPSKTE